MKKMYETMIAALKPSSSENTKMAKELELINEMHQKELMESKQRQLEIIASLERQIHELKLALAERENEVKNHLKKEDDRDKEYKSKQAEAESRQRELEAKIAKLENKSTKQQEIASLDAEVKVANANIAIEKFKAEHGQELDKLKQSYESTLKEIKYIYEREKLINEGRLEKAYNEIKFLQSKNEGCNTSRNLNEIQDTYLEEIREMNEQLDTFKKQANEEMETYKKQRDDAFVRADSLEFEVSKLKKAQVMNLPKTEKVNQSGEEIDNEQDELKQAKKQVSDLKSYIAKLEGNEKAMKMLMAQHDKMGKEESRNVEGVRGNAGKKRECNLPSM